MKPNILVHCGADDEENPWFHDKEKAFEKAVAIGMDILTQSDSALDAVEAAISHLEDSTFCDAGSGSFIQLDGVIRMDAGIMCSDRRAGGVIQIEQIKNPIQVARKILDYDLHLLLHGKHATQFAKKHGFPGFNKPGPFAEQTYKAYRSKINDPYDYRTVSKLFNEDLINKKLGTVGAIAIDSNGFIVAGTSTGGLRSGYPGRVGDSAIFGAGTYAHTLAGISVTGVGEKVIKLTLARLTYSLIKRGAPPQLACEQAVEELQQAHAVGGVTAVDNQGRFGAHYNTKTMIWGTGRE